MLKNALLFTVYTFTMLQGCGSMAEVSGNEYDKASTQAALDNAPITPILKSVGNLACPLVDGVTPGSIATLRGSGLTAMDCVATSQYLPLANRLDGLTCDAGINLRWKTPTGSNVYRRASLFYASPTEIQFHVPGDIPADAQVWVGVMYVKQTFEWIETKSLANNLCIFGQYETVSSSQPAQGYYGRFQLVDAQTGALSNVTDTNRAKPGDLVLAYGTGAGRTTQPIGDGSFTPSSSLFGTTFKPTVAYMNLTTFDMVPIEPNTATDGTDTFYTLRTPGMVGLDQISFVVPSEAKPDADGDLPLTIGNSDVFLRMQK